MASRIGRTTVIRGNIRGDGDLDIEGHIEGSVSVTGTLTVADTGLVQSDIDASRIVVRGAVSGNVVARESVVIEEGARVVGDLRAPQIGVRPGALVRGFVTTREGSSDAQVRARPASAAAPARTQQEVARPAAKSSGNAQPAVGVQRPLMPPRPVHAAHATSSNDPRPMQVQKPAPPPPVVPALRKGAKASLKRRAGK